MSKIIKYNNLTIDENKINIEVPTFNEINHQNIDDENTFDEFDENEGFETDGLVDEEEIIDNPEDIIENAKAEAEEIINSAKLEAEEIVAKAEADANNLKEEIISDAKDEGYQSGLNQAMEETQQKKEEAEKILSDARKEKEELLSSAEPEIIELVNNVINKLVNNAKIINKDVIKCVIRKGLSQTKIMGDIFIHVSSDDFEAVTEAKEEIMAEVDGNANIEIVKDLSLNAGDCLIETPFGNIDCGISQQLEEVKNSLNYILENR